MTCIVIPIFPVKVPEMAVEKRYTRGVSINGAPPKILGWKILVEMDDEKFIGKSSTWFFFYMGIGYPNN